MIAAAALRRSAARAPALARQMSGDSATAAKEMAQWRTYSYGIVGFSSLLTIGIFATMDDSHGHPKENPYSYEKIRTKPYPWECSNCNLFDGHCWEECRKKKAGN